MEQVRLWPINSLPIPFKIPVEEKAEAVPEPEVDIDDNFPKGRIHIYFQNQEYGYIKDRAGREIYFKLTEMDFVGFKGKDSIKEGAVVGYDIARSGAGLRVKKMKIY